MKLLNPIALLVLLLLSSCVREDYTLQQTEDLLSPEFGIPLAKGTIRSDELIRRYERGFTIGDGEGLVTLVYKDTLDPILLDDFLQLPNQALGFTYELSEAEKELLDTEGFLSITVDENFPFYSSTDRLDSMIFEAGTYQLIVGSEGEYDLQASMLVQDPNSGETYIDVGFEDKEPPIYFEELIDLADLKLRFSNDGTNVNALRIIAEFNITKNDKTPSEEFSIFFGFQDMVVKAAWGYITPRVLTFPSEDAFIRPFNSAYEGTFRIEDPSINLKIGNSYGLSVRPIANRITAVDLQNNRLVVEGSNINDFPVFTGADIPGDTVFTLVEIDNSSMTPTVTDLIAFKPQRIIGDFAVELNPDNDSTNYVALDQSLNVDFEVEIPILGSIKDFRLVDTADFTVPDVIDQAQEATLRLTSFNAMPLGAGLRMRLLNELLEPIDTLLSEDDFILVPPEVNLSVPPDNPSYGRVIAPSRNLVEWKLDAEGIELLKQTEFIEFSIFGNTTGNGDHPIRLFPEDAVEFLLSAKFKL